jgi:hypothetical protein
MLLKAKLLVVAVLVLMASAIPAAMATTYKPKPQPKPQPKNVTLQSAQGGDNTTGDQCSGWVNCNGVSTSTNISGGGGNTQLADSNTGNESYQDSSATNFSFSR